jgi:uncharacterized membrane protein
MVSFLAYTLQTNRYKDIRIYIINNQDHTHIMLYKKDEVLFRDSRFVLAFLLLSIIVIFMAVSYHQV